jgi:hypothetical protein
MTGKLVTELVNGNLPAGNHRITLVTHHFPAGAYLLKMVYNGKVITKKILKE